MYKVGDKVRITKEGSHGFKIGEVLILKEECKISLISLSKYKYWDAKSLSSERLRYIHEQEIESINHKETPKPKEYTQYQKTVLKAELKEQRG